MNGIAIINNSDNQYTWLFIRSNMTPLVGDFNFTTLLFCCDYWASSIIPAVSASFMFKQNPSL